MSPRPDEIRTVDCGPYLAGTSGSDEACAQVQRIMCEDGIIAFRDPRVDPRLVERIQRLMIDYFNQSSELKDPDEKKELNHQVGWTPGFTEIPNPKHYARAIEDGLDPPPHPVIGSDPKERFFAAIGTPPPYETAFPVLNAPPVVPAAFADVWQSTIMAYAAVTKATVWTFLEMLATSWGLPMNFFTEEFEYGPHLFAPTGSDMVKYCEPGTVLAGVHGDVGGVSIHGPANLPGLHAWTKSGRRIQVRVPKGQFLIQAAQQLEWLTGGEIIAGLHEVVTLEEVLTRIRAAIAALEQLWRVTSTCFFHMSSDRTSGPKGRFATEQALKKYRPEVAGTQLLVELGVINL